MDVVKNQPGVESVSAANVLPFDPIGWTDDLAVEDNPTTPFTAIYNPIMPGYFHVMRIPLAEGRDFSESDNASAAPVVIVDRRFAQKTWPGQSAIGKKLILHPQSTRTRQTLEVVGVANYTRSSIQPDARPQVYVPFGSDYGFFLMMTVRTNTDPEALATALRSAIEEVGGRRPVWDIRTMNDYVAAAMSETRFALILLGLCPGWRSFLRLSVSTPWSRIPWRNGCTSLPSGSRSAHNLATSFDWRWVGDRAYGCGRGDRNYRRGAGQPFSASNLV